MILARLVLFACAVLLPAGSALAQAVAPVVFKGPPAPVAPEVVSRDEEGRVTLRATRTEALNVDGKLDDRAYTTVKSVSDFIQQEPREGEPASEKTEVWVLFDDKNLYVSCRCWDSDMTHIVANEMRRDNQNQVQNDAIMVILDTFHDRRNGFLFSVTPIGGITDGLVTDERQFNKDWNTVWDAKVTRHDWGWAAEMVIPFKSLRYKSGEAQTWGINFRRTVRRQNEWTHLTRVPASFGNNGLYKVSVAATLVGLEVPSSGKNLEIKPYGIYGVRTDLISEPAVRNSRERDFGFDVKAGLTRNVTADLTYNTDFAQVEEDEQQVNLTRFNQFFPEKRDFFLEGQGIFSFGGGGAAPGGSGAPGGGGGGGGAPGGGGGAGGEEVPILFFSRRIGLSGGRPVPIRGGARLTGKAGNYSIGLLNIQTGDEPATKAPTTNFSVVRLRRDVFRRSTIGFLATSRSASMVGHGSNNAFAADGVFSFFDNVNVNTYVARTLTPGLRGKNMSYRAELDYGADRYGLNVDRLVVGEHFNPEVGFLRRENFKRNVAQVRFSPRPSRNGPFRAVRRFSSSARYEYTTNGENRVETREWRFGPFRTEFQSGDWVGFLVDRTYEFIERPFSVAEGVTIPAGQYEFVNLQARNLLGQQRRVSGMIEFDRGGFYGGHKTGAGFRGGRLKITPQLAFEPGVSFAWIDLPSGKFITKLVSTRATFTVTPRMFMAALVQYNSTNTSFNTNIRLRWEYRPGSELFVVYTEGRDTFSAGAPQLESRGLVVKVNRLFRF